MGANSHIGSKARAAGSPFASPALAALLIIAVAVATRVVAWWNPVADIDPPFYNLVGQELLSGHWPYVDIWDRKPLGLFLIYAAIGWLTGGSLVTLNVAATAFAAATAWVVRQISLGFATPRAATFAALVYLLFLPPLFGQTAQSPVFYNLFMAGAALLLIRASGEAEASNIRLHAFGAMLLCGLSIWVKQVAFVEGAFFGLAFLWLLWRREERPGALAITAIAMIAVALAPNLVGLAGYGLAGQAALDAYVHANFVSIFQRTSWGWQSRIAGMAFFLLTLFPLLALAAVSLRQRLKGGGDLKSRLLAGWLASALLGFLVVPEFFPHYALPLLLPLCVAASCFFDRPSGPLFLGTIAAFVLVQGHILDVRSNRTGAREYAELHDIVQKARRGGCIYIAEGPTHLYTTTGACRLTRYIFPDHLNLKTEAGAVGTDTAVETARVLGQRPAVIVLQNRDPRRYQPEVYRTLTGTLRRDYALVYRTPADAPRLIRDVRVWQRRDLAPS